MSATGCAIEARGRPGEIEVAAGLIFHDHRLLIARRRRQDHLGGLWEFPGGKRMTHESFEECLRRELMEELGVEVQVGELLETVRHAYPDRAVLLKFFRCVLESGRPRPLGCDAIAWVRAGDLSRYSFPAADAALIGQLTSTPAWWTKDPTDQSPP